MASDDYRFFGSKITWIIDSNRSMAIIKHTNFTEVNLAFPYRLHSGTTIRYSYFI